MMEIVMLWSCACARQCSWLEVFLLFP